ncbi:TolC family protein [Halomonas sp. 1390]|uniref:TolC family protein n=1 Tax=Halomonas sp. B23F22_3 TaxID=3459516 RepID=UPI00373EA42B
MTTLRMHGCRHWHRTAGGVTLAGAVLLLPLSAMPVGAADTSDATVLETLPVPESPTQNGNSPGEPMRSERLPSLPALYRQALSNDSELSRQRYQLQSTRQEAPLARSQLLPQVTASGGYLYQDSTNIQTEPDEFGLDQPGQRPGEITDDYWQLQIQQSLFSLERWRGMARADAEIGAAELDLALVERDLALTLSEAYVNAFTASQKQALLEAQQASLELQVQQAERAYDLGVGDRINVLEAHSRLDQAIADAVQAENELNDALSELERLTGQIPQFGEPSLGNLPSLNLENDWAAEEALLAKIDANLDVRRAKAEQRLNQRETAVRRSGYYPELSLNLSYSDRQSEDELRTSEDYRAGVEVSMPLYRGGRTLAGVRQGELRVKASREAVAHQRNLATQEVRTRLRSLQGNQRRLAALGRAIESSKLFLEAAERGETLGLRDLVDVLDAKASLFDQRIKFVETLAQQVLDRLALAKAVGELGTEQLARAMQRLARLSGA